MADTKKPRSIDEAIETLDNAYANQQAPDLAASSAAGLDQIKSTLLNNFETVSQTIASNGAIAFDGLSQFTTAGVAQAQVVAKDIDQRVRANPWPFIGGAAVGMLALGYFLGKNQNPKEAQVTTDYPAN